MADVIEERAIDDLPAVSNVTDSIQFPVSQDGTAMRLSVADLETKMKRSDVVTVSGGSASQTASEIYNTIVNSGKNITVMVSGSDSDNYSVCRIEKVEKNGNDYTAYFEVDSAVGSTTQYAIDASGNVSSVDSYDVERPSKSTLFTGDARLSLNYTPTSNTHAVNKAYVDAAVASGGGGSSDVLDIVIVTISQSDSKAYHNGTAITGSQINNYVSSGKMVFLWQEVYSRLFSYSETDGSGNAKFIFVSGNGVTTAKVFASSNTTTVSFVPYLPSVDVYDDEGKALGVVNGSWAKTSQVLPTVTTSDNGMVLGVVNGNWTLVDPTTLISE